jgi:hypothetical protein
MSPSESLSEERRKEIYLALAEAQDLQEMSVLQSRKLIAHRFGISEAQLREMEREGRDRLWSSV